MYRATTPTLIFIFPPEADIAQASEIYITFAKPNGKEILTKTGADIEIDENEVSVYFTQEDSLKMPCGSVKCQINWLYDEGGTAKRACSQIMTIFALDNLIDEVLS